MKCCKSSVLLVDPAKHEVQMKIDNLNVEDMFDSYRLNRLLDVFRCELWHESENDLYVTFLASAVHLGARHPLRPNEGEGLVFGVTELCLLYWHC